MKLSETLQWFGRINLISIWDWIKRWRLNRLHQVLVKSRERYHRALHRPITEVQLYDPDALHNKE